MKKSDAYTVAHITPSRELMYRAAVGIVEAGDWKEPVAVVCGIGNNAGDGFAAAMLLCDRQIAVELFLLSDRFSEDGSYYYAECQKRAIPVHHDIETADFTKYGSILDCIFGVGLRGSIGKPYSTAIRKINESGVYTVSADINSGLGGDSGLPSVSAETGEADAAVKSDLTVSVGSFKSGHCLNAAKDYIAAKVNCDIGIRPLDPPFYLIEKSDIAPLLIRERQLCHKGDFGYVALIGGSVEYSGAAKLANLAVTALRAGAGVSKLAVPHCLAEAVLPYLLESTLFLLDDENGKYRFSAETTENLLRSTKAAAVGMGMGRSDDGVKLIEYLLSHYRGRLIIDADGLNMLSGFDREKIRHAVCRLILTPHLKEFERLSGVRIADFQSDPVQAAKEYAADTGVILLLKGPTTVITDGNTVYLADRGCAGMATAGSGDVLSGILTGLCGFVPDDRLLLGIAAGAYLNGLAGELAEQTVPALSMTSSDTVSHIPAAVRMICDG